MRQPEPTIMLIALFLLAGVALVACEVSLTCPDGWTRFADECYRISRGSLSLTANDAKAECRAQGARIASLRDQDELDFVTDVLAPDYVNSLCDDVDGIWIGYSNPNNPNIWIWDGSTSGSPSNWGIEIPAEANYCAYIDPDLDFQWNAQPCDNDTLGDMGYVCEGDMVLGDCDTLGHCYWIPDGYIDECALVGGTLAYIESDEESDFIKTFIDECIGFLAPYTDIYAFDISSGLYISNSIDNSTYYNWADGEPNGDGDCIALSGSGDHQWYDVPCGEARLYLCETDVDAIIIGK